MTPEQWIAAGGPVAIDAPQAEIPIYEPGSFADWTNTFKQSLGDIGGLPFAAERSEPVQAVAKGSAALFDIVTDLPRIATIVVGGILIVGGVFALVKASSDQVIASLVKP